MRLLGGQKESKAGEKTEGGANPTKMPPLFARWFFSYLWVLLPMVLLCTALLILSAVTLDRDFQRLQKMELDTVAKQYENDVAAIRTAVLGLYNNADLRKVVSRTRQEVKYEEYSAMERVREAVLSMCSSMPHCDNVFLYLNWSGYMIEPMRVLQLDDMYRLGFRPFDTEGLEDGLREEIIQNADSNQLAVVGPAGDGACVLYEYILPSPYNRAAHTAVFVSLTLDRLLKDMAADMGTSAEFALYTDSGQLLADTDPKLFASIDFSAIRAGGANQRMGAWSVRAAALPLSVMLVRAIDGGLEGALNQWTMLSLCIVFSVALIACILLGYLYAKRHYRPVSRMISILDEEEEPGGDEYDRMRRALMEAVAYRAKQKARSQVWKELKLDSEFMRGLPLEQGHALLNDRFLQEQQPADGQFFCTAEIAPVGYATDSKEEISFFKDILFHCKQLLLTHARVCCSCVAAADNMRILLFVRMKAQTESQMITMKFHVQEAVRFLRENDLIDCRCCFSRVMAYAESWESLYRQMMEQIEYARYSALSDSAPWGYRSASKEEEKLRGMLSRAQMHLADGAYDDIGRELKDVLQLLPECGAAEDGAAQQGDTAYTLKRQVMDIIRSDYTNPDLNVTEIASRMGRNPDALSRAFRETTHIGILEYIHLIRIKAAKEMLSSDSGMTVLQIGRICGYGNIDSFMRVFKRLEGVTPGKYRDQIMRKT